VATIENINDQLVDDIDVWPLLLTPKRSQVNVWIGQPGVWAHLHYGLLITSHHIITVLTTFVNMFGCMTINR
jgi:hypothetical protein